MIALLRLLATLAVFLAVAFVIYNAFISRDTIVVKPFQMPVSTEKNNHAHAGRIVANVLKHHLIKTEQQFQDELSRNSSKSKSGPAYTPRAVTFNNQVWIQGESIKLPETGISIENVIEFISGIFGRKNLNGAVYFEQDSDEQGNNHYKLSLQIILGGRIVSFTEDELNQDKRTSLPPTHPDSLNLQLISAMLELKSKEILSIASEDHNLYYYCTRATKNIEHRLSDHKAVFAYCNALHDGNATPQSLFTLKQELASIPTVSSEDVIARPVMKFLRAEVEKKHAALCQNDEAIKTPACENITRKTLASAKPVTRSTSAPVSSTAAVIAATTIPAANLSETGAAAAVPQTSGIVEALQVECFPKVNGLTLQQVAFVGIKDSRQSNKLEGDATQLLNNGLYQEALENFQKSIRLNCTNSVSWANMGILFTTAGPTSELRNPVQAELALKQAIMLKEGAGWIHHSLCVAQAFAHEKDLEQYLQNDSCATARQLEPINEALFDKLFRIEIARRYRETGQLPESLAAYRDSMTTETRRGCHMKWAVRGMLQLEEQQTNGAKPALCDVLNAVPKSPEDAEITACETEVNKLTENINCPAS